MRLIKSNSIKSEYPKRIMCDNCEAELEIEESDVFVGEFGCYLFKCPCCGHNTPIDGMERDIPPTFKKTFWHTSVNGNVKAKHIPDDEIQQMIDKCVANLISDDVEPGEFSMQGTGDTAVYAFKYEDCIEILVTQDYWEDSVFKDDYHLIKG